MMNHISVKLYHNIIVYDITQKSLQINVVMLYYPIMTYD